MKFIDLTKGMCTTVDDKDFESLGKHKWCVSESSYSFYARRRKGSVLVYMHRVLVGNPVGYQVHHINGDTLDNRRSNLEICFAADHGGFSRSGRGV